MVMAGKWENVSESVRPVGTRRGTRHSMAHTLQHLETASDYLAVIRVRNKYGWSSESDHFSFSTKKGQWVVLVGRHEACVAKYYMECDERAICTTPSQYHIKGLEPYIFTHIVAE